MATPDQDCAGAAHVFPLWAVRQAPQPIWCKCGEMTAWAYRGPDGETVYDTAAPSEPTGKENG